jgi:hypothetical protein
MTGKRDNPSEQPEPTTSAGAWGLRYPGLVMSTGGKNEVKEFTGMWRLSGVPRQRIANARRPRDTRLPKASRRTAA